MGIRRFPWWLYLAALILILALALWPVASIYLTYLVADAHGCTVNEASINPCIVFGNDLGGLLYGMGVMGWFMLATIPIGAFAFIVWLVVLVIHRILWRRRNRPVS